MSALVRAWALDFGWAPIVDGLRLRLHLARLNRTERSAGRRPPSSSPIPIRRSANGTPRAANDEQLDQSPLATQPSTYPEFAGRERVDDRLDDGGQHALSSPDEPVVEAGDEVAPRARSRRWATWSALALVVAPIAAPMVIAHVRLGQVTAEYSDLEARATAIRIVDSRGVEIGLRAQPGQDSRRIVLRSTSVPGDFYRMLEWLEDRHTSPFRNWYGIDYVRSGRSVLCYFGRSLALRDANECGGASTLIMQAARGAHGWYGGQASGRASRKATEYWDAPSLSVLYPRGSIERQRFVADNLTYGYTTSGFELWGIRNASRVIFGVEPTQLSLAQQAVLAALPRRRLVLRCDRPTVEQQRREELVWERIRGRADLALANAYPAGDPRARVARAELARMARPTQPAPLPAAVATAIAPERRCAAAANPVRRAEELASSEMSALVPELQRLSAEHRAPVTEVALTVDLASQEAFKRSVDELLRTIQSSQRSALIQPLLTDGRASNIDLLLVATREDGSIRNLYASHARGLLDRPRRVGSIGKLVVGMAAAEVSDPDASLCARTDHGQNPVLEADGSPGFDECRGRALVSLVEAFGRSRNLPIFDLANRIGERRVREAAAAAGFVFPAEVPPGRALVTGMGETSPRSLLSFTQALANGAAGRAPEAYAPFILARARIGNQWIEPSRGRMRLPSRYFSSAASRRFIAQAGGAALNFPRGTLRALVVGAQPTAGEIAKSGTVAGPRPALNTIASLASGAAPGFYSWVFVAAASRDTLGDRSLRFSTLPRLIRSAAKRFR